jgi:hypothetical protein
MDKESKRQERAAHLEGAGQQGVMLSACARVGTGPNVERLYDAKRRQWRRATDSADVSHSPQYRLT